ncbi:MAG: nuclear transport factor 2 family protein [Deltaproteobacteria bacterium]
MNKQNAVEKFFSGIGGGNMDEILEAVHKDAVFEAQGPGTVPIYNTFHGKEGVTEFVRILGELFDTEDFKVYVTAPHEDYIFAYGLMKHRVRATGKIFECEWALVCKIKEGKIISYKMFEDTFALERAFKA